MTLEDLSVFFEDPALSAVVEQDLTENFKDPKAKEEGIQKISEFVLYFSLFQGLKALRAELHRSIRDSIEMAENVADLSELMQKTILLRLVEIYVDNARLEQKDKILNILSSSLETLAPGPLFLNLGLLVKPVFQDEEFQQKQETQEEKEIVYAVEYTPVSSHDVEIKHAIDNWIRSQQLNLDSQEILHLSLKNQFEQECSTRGVTPRDDLLMQCQEMLNMQLTIVSLQMSLEDDEDCAPVKL
ncbi:MAG TPA: hypothetical protein VKK79_11670 [Candidatus Lokiarchaeia archaeon]|nr:hypothetical protein [Candidatus Lokiarchaeia archaeon]